MTHREKPVTNFALPKCNSYRYASALLIMDLHAHLCTNEVGRCKVEAVDP